MKENRSPALIGASSLLVMFAVLCLTVFALLSLSTAQANARLSEASAQSVKDYYLADCEAEEIFARLRAGEVPEGVSISGDCCSYTCPLSETQKLNVELRRSGNHWTVLRWQTVSTADWTAEDDLPVWTGN